MFKPGQVYVVDKFPRRNSKGLILYAAESMTAVRVPRYSKLIYMQQHSSGDFLFLLNGQLVRAPFEIAKYLITFEQFIYNQQILKTLQRAG